MANAITLTSKAHLTNESSSMVPSLFTNAGEQAAYRFAEFFAASIRNLHTRRAYYRSVCRFADWCAMHGMALEQVNPIVIAGYTEQLMASYSTPSVLQHLAALRMLFDYLVAGNVLPFNPAAAVKSPKYVVNEGKTPVLTADEARHLLDSIDLGKISGLRDKALIGVMIYSFARVGAVVKMNVEDYFPQGKRWKFRLHEKGGKHHTIWAHHKAEEALDAYISAAGIESERKFPLFRTINARRQLSEQRITENDVLRMVKRRARQAELPESTCCHTFRATGITDYLQNGGRLEYAQQLAAHSSSKTTKLYDRRNDEINLDEIERVHI